MELTSEEIYDQLEATLLEMKNSKPDGRSEASRHWAVAITEMEKVVAYFGQYIAGR